MKLTSWRASIRLALRDILRTKGRSLLIIALVGLPILMLSGADVIWRSYHLDNDETITRDLGSAEARMEWLGEAIAQTPDGGSSTLSSGWQSFNQPRPRLSLEQAAALVSPSAKVTRIALSAATVRVGNNWEYADLTAYDYDSPTSRGKVVSLQGHAPRRAEEVSLSKALVDKGHLHLGDTVQFSAGTPGGPVQRTLVGIISETESTDKLMVYVPESAAVETDGPDDKGIHVRYLVSGAPVPWSTVLKLNQAGYLVNSRDARLHPPGANTLPTYFAATGSWSDHSRLITTGILAGMALLEVVLLAGPAFAIGARRDKRQLALIAAVGGSRRDVRRVVLTRALLLGLGAGVVGAVSGVIAGTVSKDLVAAAFNAPPGRLKVPYAEVALLVLVSALTCLAAAMLPAYQAGKADVVAALTGRRDRARRLKRVPALGALIILAGVIVGVVGVNKLRSENVMFAGILVAELGLITCTPALLGLVGRLARFLPLAGRLALRDANRNRASTAPAIAAVMACVVAGITVSVMVASEHGKSKYQYVPIAASGDARVLVGANDAAGGEARAKKITDILKVSLPVKNIDVVKWAQAQCPGAKAPGEETCNALVIIVGGGECQTDTNIPCLKGYGGSDISVDDGTNVGAFFADQDSIVRARSALRAGKVVVGSPTLTSDGVSSLSVGPPDPTDGAPARPWHRYPAVFVPFSYPGIVGFGAIVPPSVAKELGLTPVASEVVAHNDHMPTAAEEQQAKAGLASIDEYAQLLVAHGYVSPTDYRLLGLVAGGIFLSVAAAGIATALANANGTADMQTLSHIGASRRVRRRISMARAATISLLGVGFGLPAGFLSAWAWVELVRANGPIFPNGMAPASTAASFQHEMPFAVSWSTLAVLLIALPVCAIASAGLLTRSRMPVGAIQ